MKQSPLVSTLVIARSRNAEPHPLVLIAEDDAALREVLSEGLREVGCKVRTAGDGRELLAMLTMVSRKEMPMPSLIIMDVRMPRCSGMDVLTALRLADWHVPVLMISGFADLELHDRAGTLGAVMLDKPFDLETLRCVVGALCTISEGEVRSSSAPTEEVS